MTNYEKEAMKFGNHFNGFKHSRIILYGTGRYTATLLPRLQGQWNIVGLMDKNPEYIGKKMFGLPVLDEKEAVAKADMIIINTSGAYWQIIYQRIEHLGLPVYYQNGERAKKKDTEYEHIEYWDVTQEKLFNQINEHDVISFDFYDTLFQRKVYLPSEIFHMTAAQSVGKKAQEQYIQVRKNAGTCVGDENVSIDMIYNEVQRQMHWTNEKTDRIKAKEIELEAEQLTAREDVIAALKYAIALKKEVYIISDMYLHGKFFEQMLLKKYICVESSHIWVSCEKKVSKESGSLWKKFRNHVESKRILHIGDNLTDDVLNAKKYDIDAFYCMSKNELMSHSSMSSILPAARSEYHMMLLGLCENRLFSKAFELGKTSGKIYFADRRDFGYVVFGPVFLSYLYWIKQKVLEEDIEHLVFLGRDGYFLKENFDYLEKLSKDSRTRTYYLETSRQILMCASMQSAEEFSDYVRFPYRGSIHNYVEDRFGIVLSEEDDFKYGDQMIDTVRDYKMLIVLLRSYMDAIRENIDRNRKCYRQYLRNVMQPAQWTSGKIAVVDLGYYGTNQYYLSRITEQRLKGYYMMADLSENNMYCRKNKMDACACDSLKKTSETKNVYKNDLVLESFLTSPVGMITGMQDDGTFVYDTGKKNQELFGDKIEINEGVKMFIYDMVKYYSACLDNRMDVYIDDFVDWWYGACLDNCMISEAIKRSFYNDNAFVHRGQERVFE